MVHDIEFTRPELVARAIRVVLDDFGADAIKIGMLGTVGIVNAVISALRDHGSKIPIVLDPVMIASSGRRLLDLAAIEALRDELLPMAFLLTPNLDEAAILANSALSTIERIEAAANRLRSAGAAAVLIKGGHGAGDEIIDVLAGPSGITRFAAPRTSTRHGHGTGCTLASAIATRLGGGMDLIPAIERGRDFVRAALLAAPGYGAGAGPLGHAEARLGTDP